MRWQGLGEVPFVPSGPFLITGTQALFKGIIATGQQLIVVVFSYLLSPTNKMQVTVNAGSSGAH